MDIQRVRCKVAQGKKMREIIHSSLKLDVVSFVFFPLGLSAMIQFYNFENGLSRYDRNVDWSDGISEDNKLITAELS